MSSSKNTAHSKDSTSNSVRLFKIRCPDHRVVTRSDLTTDYPGNDGNEESPRPSNSDGVVAINNYHTWNSSRTNSSIHKKRAEIISALHSVKSASELHRGITRCNGFARSYMSMDIMSMCADRRCDFSSDDYHDHDHGNSGNERDAVETEPEDVAPARPTSGSATAVRHSWSSSYIGGAPRCWSCTATDRESDDDDGGNDNNLTADDDDGGNDNNSTADEAHYGRTSDNQRLSWIQKLNRKFRNSRESR